MHCEVCGISLEPDADGLVCTQCKTRGMVPGDYVLLSSDTEELTQGDADILAGSMGRSVRYDKGKDAEVKRLYKMYITL